MYEPTLGAVPDGVGTRFTVWAPEARVVEVELRAAGGFDRRRLAPAGDGTFTAAFEVGAGTRYRFLVDGRGPFPDPASRSQPDGVHGASEVVDPRTFAWTDASWTGVAIEEAVIYELHIGTFTDEGTFAGAARRLPDLARLGITVVELMPLADFPGDRNWGYDGVSLYAPARCYGRPDDLRRFVDAAHALGLAVLVDVVYNHLGPDGAYHGQFSRFYHADRESPWGRAMNLDGPHSGHVRRFLIENALHWLCEYHADGLRLDATHALLDGGTPHLVAEITTRVRETVTGRHALVVAEDHRNLAVMIRPPAEGGWGLDAVWADDFHHQVRRRTAGDRDGYYRDYAGTTEDLAATVSQGWFFCGQHSAYLGECRGTSPAGLPPWRFVICLQNHDQVGNRALGERLHHQIPLPLYRAVSALLVLAPETPLLFMGQEWAATSPFLYFTDHESGLGRLVTEGRRREFARFAAFADPGVRERIPDPQAESTFTSSRLRWADRDDEPQASTLRYYRALLAARRTDPTLHPSSRGSGRVTAIDADTIVLDRAATGHRCAVVLVVHLGTGGDVELELPAVDGGRPPVVPWICALSSEGAGFAPDLVAIDVAVSGGVARLRFLRPGAVLLIGGGA
jgi:maltooligosyltrehalose trehalohydrolase